jgi:hypothetical protein
MNARYFESKVVKILKTSAVHHLYRGFKPKINAGIAHDFLQHKIGPSSRIHIQQLDTGTGSDNKLYL